ncbi:unnamed protein product [Paramecium sonneborni]|uniref:Uncharacterized protein n=1 Tax=Paramecium sonneborni TaxID=65129 RepID=A0A8S1KNQ4_9CILI|nr:unnamed protein product [Paramecium sonneborni]
MHKDLNYAIEIMEIEKLKLHEQIDYLQQQIQQLTNEYSDKILEKDEELVTAFIKMQQAEKINNDLVLKLHSTKKSEEQLNNANYNFITLQKKLDHQIQENQKLEQKVKLLTEQSMQFQQKWQRVSMQLKQSTTQKVSARTIEQQLSLKQEECQQLKEKLVQYQLELTIFKQSDQEYKQSVHQKMQALYQELKDTQQKLQQNLYLSQQQKQDCQQCEYLRNETEQLKQIINQDHISQEQNRINIQINQQQQQQLKEYQKRLMELEYENQNLKQQIQLPESINFKSRDCLNIKSITNHPLYIKMMKLIEQLTNQTQQELFRKSLNELGSEIEQRENKEQQLQECRTMYDRLLIKYYALQKSINKIEENTNKNYYATQQITSSKQQTQQKKTNQLDSFLQEQETTKQMKQSIFSNTPKQRIVVNLKNDIYFKIKYIDFFQYIQRIIIFNFFKMQYCQIHNPQFYQTEQQQRAQQQMQPQHIFLINKYKNKKKAYKESLNDLRNQMKFILDKQLYQEQELTQLKTQYHLEKEQWQQEKKILNSLFPQKDLNFNGLQKEKKSYKEKKKELEQQLQKQQQQCQFQEGKFQEILLENSKLKAIINGRDQECLALQQEVEYYQKRLIQLQRQ